MTRKEVYAEIEQMFGLVPTFFKAIPDDSLGMEWQLMKTVQFEEGAIPNKYRELIGLGIAATTKCRYCALFHTEAAKLFGATDAEIEDAVHYAKSSAGWSAWLNGNAVRLRHVQERSAADGQARPQPDDEVQRRLALRAAAAGLICRGLSRTQPDNGACIRSARCCAARRGLVSAFSPVHAQLLISAHFRA